MYLNNIFLKKEKLYLIIEFGRIIIEINKRLTNKIRNNHFFILFKYYKLIYISNYLLC